MSLNFASQTSMKKQTCFSTCLTIKGIEPSEREIRKLQGSRHRKMLLQMWVPTNSLVVKLPDIEVTGTCLVPPTENDDQNTRVINEPQEPRCSCAPSVSELLCLEKHCSNGSHGREYADEIDDKTIEGNVFSLLESSLDKELSLDHTDVIPCWLTRRSNTSPKPSAQFGSSPSPYFGTSRPHSVQDHILPKDLKFGIRNATSAQYRKATRRQGVAVEDRQKVLPSFCRGNLEPLLLRTKPAKNLHEELEREEMEGTVFY